MDAVKLISDNASVDMATIYGLIGAVIVSQFGVIITMIVWLLKATWKASQMNSDIERLKKDTNVAFSIIRKDGLKSGSCSAEETNN